MRIAMIGTGYVGLVLVVEHSGKAFRFELTDSGAAAAAERDAFTFRVPPRK